MKQWSWNSVLKDFVLNCRVLMGGMVGPISDTFSHWYHQLMVSIFNQSRDRCSNPSDRFWLLQSPLKCQHCHHFWHHFCHLVLQQLWGKLTWPDLLCLNSFLGRKLHPWNLHSIPKTVDWSKPFTKVYVIKQIAQYIFSSMFRNFQHSTEFIVTNYFIYISTLSRKFQDS